MGIFGKDRIVDPYGTQGTGGGKPSKPKQKQKPSGPKLSVADKDAANFLASAIHRYGPLTRQQVEAYARQQRQSRSAGSDSTAYGLERIAAEMKPDDVVSDTVPWRKRF